MTTPILHRKPHTFKPQHKNPEVCHACACDYIITEGGVLAIQVMIGDEPFGAPLGFPICPACYEKSRESAIACKVVEGKVRANNAELFAAIEGGVRGFMQGLHSFRRGGK